MIPKPQRGEEQMWNTLAGLSTDDVCRRTDAVFDTAAGLYRLKSFGRSFSVSPQERKILFDSGDDELFFKKVAYFLRLSVIGYLSVSKDIALTGRLVNPVNMKSGQLFFRGSHVLPLDKVAGKYGLDKQGFLQKAPSLAGEEAEYGDASLKFYPFPRVLAAVILWVADEEFGPRAELLFDSSIELQLPIDVIWSVAMMSVIAFL